MYRKPPSQASSVFLASRVGALLPALVLLMIPGCAPKQPSPPDLFRAALRAAVPSPARLGNVEAAYDRIPLQFEANRGQSDPQVKFLARGQGYSLFLTDTEAVLALRQPREKRSAISHQLSARTERQVPIGSTVLRMQLVGANGTPAVAGHDELPGTVNYLLGNDPASWRTHIPTYAKVRYREVYPGVDLIYYGTQRHLEYDFLITPGADPGVVTLRFQGTDSLELMPEGDLLLNLPGGAVRLKQPGIYQEVDGVRYPIDGRYVRKGTREIGFQIADYDPSRPLVIDPALVFSTFLGGQGQDIAHAIGVDDHGNVYVAGETASSDFPTTPGAFDQRPGLGYKAFVTKLNPAGSALVYSTLLGGRSCSNVATALAVDSLGHVYVAGETDCPDFPTTPGAFDRTSHGGGRDAFVAKLAPDGGSLVYSTFLGGSDYDELGALALDSQGHAYVAGETASSDFPTTPGAFDRTCHACRNGSGDAFVTKLAPDGSALVYSTLLGGSAKDHATGIALDSLGNAYVAGYTLSGDFPTTPGAFDRTYHGFYDAFVTRLSTDGSALIYSTFLGGQEDDTAMGLAVDGEGQAYVVGRAYSRDFPTTPEAYDHTPHGGYKAFVTKFAPDGSSLVYSTFLRGMYGENGKAIAIDRAGYAYVAGETGSPDFPTTPGAISRTYSGNGDTFVTKLSPDGSALIYSTFLGGYFDEFAEAIAVDARGNAYVTGFTSSGDFPTTEGAFDRGYHGGDAFVAKLDLTSGPSVAVSVIPSVFYRSGHLTVQATTTPGAMSVTVDAYVALQLPDGGLLFLRGDGSFTGTIEPFVRDWTVGAFSGQVFAYTLVGGEPLGNYAWLAAFTEPGTLNIIGRIAWAPFVVVNP